MALPTTPALAQLQRSINVVHNPVTAWIILGLSFFFTVFAYFYAKNQVEQRSEEQFKFRTQELILAIEDRLTLYEQTLISAKGLFAASDHVDRDEWRVFVESLQLDKRFPGIQGLGYAIPLTQENLNAHIQAIRDEGFKDFRVHPEGPRETYSSIIYLEPFDWRNKRAFGYDMWSNPKRREAMMRARDTGLPSTSGVITLVQETQENVQRGFLTYVPVYKTHTTPLTPKRRLDSFQGWVYAAFRADDLMKGILGENPNNLYFKIYDGDTVHADALIYDSAQDPTASSRTDTAAFHAQKVMQLQGRDWLVAFSANQDFLSADTKASQPLYILLGGVIVELLLFYVIVSLHFINKHRKRAAEELRTLYFRNQDALTQQAKVVEAKERESETFFELAPEAFLVVNGQGEVVKANRHAHDLFGYDQGALRGCRVEDLIPENIREQHSQYRTDFFAAPTQRTMGGTSPIKGVKKCGGTFPALINLAPIDYTGKRHVVAAVRDVSIQKKIETSLANAKNSAEAASRAKSEFVANMSHEIRTPLNAVLGAAQLLNKSQPTVEQKKFIDMIRSSGEALLGIINDILDFSKIEAGAMALANTEFDLHELLSRVAIMMSVNSGEKHLELVIHVDPEVNRHYIGDPLRLQQVLINLTSNAIKFTETGTVTLAIQSLNTQGDRLRISVTDTGIGVSKEQQSHLFTAFSQADASISRRFGGTGLGLVISNRIVALMESELHLNSVPGEGSNFYFDINLPKGKITRASDLINPEVKKSILLLESHTQSANALMAIFKRLSWQVTHFETWEAALAGLSRNDTIKQFDFCLIDSRFDKLDNEVVLNNLRVLGLSPKTANILMMPNNQQAALFMSSVQKSFNAGCVKPLFKGNLLAALHEASLSATNTPIIHTPLEASGTVNHLDSVKILLVEDNPLNQTIACTMLEDMGVEVTVADNGQQAIEKVKGHNSAYDLILMDIQMPIMDGATATKILRNELDWTKPIIAMTAGVLKSEQEQCLQVGMNDLVPKPVDSNELFRAVRKALKLSSNPASTPPSEEPILNSDRNAHQMGTPPHFDAARLDQLTKGNPKRIARMVAAVQAITEEGPETLTKIEHALRDQDLDSAKLIVHNFKGVVANYGGVALSSAIAELENALPKSDERDLLPQLSTISNLYLSYCQAAQQWIDQQNSSAP